jgi:two-component SAPR family response regulator
LTLAILYQTKSMVGRTRESRALPSLLLLSLAGRTKVTHRRPKTKMRMDAKGTSERLEAVRIRLLGGFEVSVGARTIKEGDWRLRKAASLIKLLALASGNPLHREQLTYTLWPNLGISAASNNLRQTVHAARRILDAAMGSSYLASREESLVLCPQSSLWVDVEAFEETARAARRSRDLALYRSALGGVCWSETGRGEICVLCRGARP